MFSLIVLAIITLLISAGAEECLSDVSLASLKSSIYADVVPAVQFIDIRYDNATEVSARIGVTPSVFGLVRACVPATDRCIHYALFCSHQRAKAFARQLCWRPSTMRFCAQRRQVCASLIIIFSHLDVNLVIVHE